MLLWILASLAFPSDFVVDGFPTSAPGVQPGEELGRAVTAAGDVNGDGYGDVLAGAPSFDTAGVDAGRVALFFGSPIGIASVPDWTFSETQPGAQLGAAVATAGDVNGDGFDDVLVGVPFFDGGQTDEGAVYLFLGSASGLSSTPDWVAQSNVAGAQFGAAVAPAGDVDGDGFWDVLIGAPGYGNGESEEGAAFVFLGSAAGLASTPVWSAESNQADAHFGSSVARAGDVDSDGFDDVLVGAADYDSGEANEGAAFLYRGSASGPEAAASWQGESNQADASYGRSVAGIGDFDGDGYADIAVGADLFDAGFADQGRVFVYSGSAAGPATAPDFTSDGQAASDGFGASVHTAGDVDGDQRAEVVVGAPFHDRGGLTDAGEVRVLDLRSGVIATQSLYGSAVAALFGSSVAVAGDVDGDGQGDLVAGAPGVAGAAGRVDVYSGLRGGVSTTIDLAGVAFCSGQCGLPLLPPGGPSPYVWPAVGDVDGDGTVELTRETFIYYGPDYTVSADLGAQIRPGGDANGDGFADVIVGPGGFGDTRALHLGGAAGVDPQAVFTREALVLLGDVNGDGLSDYRASFFQVHAGHPSAVFPLLNNIQYAAEPLGDVNGDGFDDVEASGKVYYGGPSGLPVGADQFAFEAVVLDSGDVNGDGHLDLRLPGAWISPASPSGMTPLEGIPLERVAGDLDGDGIDDLVSVVGDSTVTVTTIRGGEFEAAGSASASVSCTPNMSCSFSFCFSCSWSPAISTRSDPLELGRTKAYLYSTVLCSCDGLNNDTSTWNTVQLPSAAIRGVRQRTADDSRTIPLRGGIPNSVFGLRVLPPGSAAGREDITLEWQVADAASSVASGSLQTSGLTVDTGTWNPDTPVFEMVTLPGVGRFKWRARFRARNPYFPHSIWFSAFGNSHEQWDLRVLDCNGNGVEDGLDGPDCNGNGVPDACELVGNDCNANGVPDDCDGGCPTGVPLCFGVGCPCGNDDPNAGCVSSRGVGARLDVTGTSSITADDLVLVATDCAALNSALYFVTTGQTTPPVAVGDGLVCAGGASYRYFPGQVDAAGVFTMANVISSAPAGFFSPGATRYFQAWTRDVLCGPPPSPCASPCGHNSNISSGCQVTFQP